MTTGQAPNDLTGVDCLGYVRVSTEKQVGEVYTSLDDQRVAIEALATRQGRVVGAWFPDEGASGATAEQRPAFRAMLGACAASPRKPSAPGLVLVLNDSRFGRFPDPEEAAYWRHHLSRLGWSVRFVESDESTNPTARTLMRAIGSAQATEYRDNIRRNAKRGSRGTAGQGFWVSRTPFGYRRRVVYPPGRGRILEPGQRKAIDEKVALVPHEAEAAIVCELFRRYATGSESLQSLIEWVIRENPSRPWTRQAVRFTLSNPAYAGDVVTGRVPADDVERAATPVRPESEWVGKRDAHPAIVSRALFHTVQKMLARHQHETSGVRSDWILRGIVRCRCGDTFGSAGGSGRSGQGVQSYRCQTRGQHPSARCAYPGAVAKHLIEPALLDVVAKVIGTPAARKRLASLINAAFVAIRTAPTDTGVALATEYATLEAKRDRLVQAVENGTLTSFEAKDRLKEIRALLGAVAARREVLERSSGTENNLDAQRERLIALATDFRAAAARLHGPALRELICPWVKDAVFDTKSRVLTVEVRRLPALGIMNLSRMPSLPCGRPPAPG